MAIGFIRSKFVSRSAGQNACAKSAYNSRSSVYFEGTAFAKSLLYNKWSKMEKPLFHTILLPEGTDPKFKDQEVLWNAVEQFENRKNSQVAEEMVMALPDDRIISDDDRIELTVSFVLKYFVANGLGVQIDIHRPDKENQNWHAHLLITTRCFSKDGKSFEKHKPRHLMPTIRGGRVIAGLDWTPRWIQHQNDMFEGKGLSLRVDPPGIVPQKHQGPVRMRGRAYSLMEEHSLRVELNLLESRQVKQILNKITETRNVFTPSDIDHYLQKYVPVEVMAEVRRQFWQQNEIIQLFDKDGRAQNKFTTKEIIEEEAQILRISERIASKTAFPLKDSRHVISITSCLKEEQTVTFQNVMEGQRLSCIQGFAGTGKSRVLAAIRDAYETAGFTVRGLGPDNATAKVLHDDCGFSKADNVYHFSFVHHHKPNIGRQEIWILDEAGKLGNRPLLEFLRLAEKHRAQVILAGDIAQMPPVERGQMFTVLNCRYGVQGLTDVQRQKLPQQREVSKNLAMGRTNVAFDLLSSCGSLRFANTRVEAMEQLVNQWAVDRERFPFSSALILAYSNAELRSLNEYVRAYRMSKGELDEREFACETAFGKIFISVGDQVEFRRNNPELGVTNGLAGTLVEADATRFLVRVSVGEQYRDIAFDPREYPFFQLGYATTYYRAQGRTVKRAYILHSPAMARQAFYVGLTRHVNHVSCFISRADTASISDLKRQALRQSRVESTIDYWTLQGLKKQEDLSVRKEELNHLKQSKSLISRIKGRALEGVDRLRDGATGLWYKMQDRMPDQTFFQPNLETNRNRAIVVEMPIAKANDDVDNKSVIKDVPDFLALSNRGRVATDLLANQSSIPQQNGWHKLPEATKTLISDYFASSDCAFNLHQVVKAEGETLRKDIRLAGHFREWQKACAKRNRLAYDVSKSLSVGELGRLFSGSSLDTICYRAARHECILQRQTELSTLEGSLCDNIDNLLFRLFPDGPTGRDRSGYRYGAGGAISVVCRGEKAGSYYNFEKGEGGGLIRLIQDLLSINKEQASQWAKDFLGASQQVTFTQSRSFKGGLEGIHQDVWISLKPPQEALAPSLRNLSRRLDEQYNEVARHAYKDGAGNLLFFNLRLVEKDKSNKIVLPLSYGHYKEDETPRWSLKAFAMERRSLYNLDLLHARPDAAVLIVEGEKTADAVLKRFTDENLIVVTWMGGTGAVTKTDWSPLFLKKVIIWPDNDLPGFKACDEITLLLRREGIASLKIVSRDLLQRDFPEKWDLADPLPIGKSNQDLRDLLVSATDKAVGLPELLANLPREKNNEQTMLLAREVLWRVEGRMRLALEADHGGKTWEVQNRIVAEATKIMSTQTEREEYLQSSLRIDRTLSCPLAIAQLVFLSSTGSEPSLGQMEELKRNMADTHLSPPVEGVGPTKGGQRYAQEFLMGKYLGECLEGRISGDFQDSSRGRLQQDLLTISKSRSQQTQIDVIRRDQPSLQIDLS